MDSNDFPNVTSYSDRHGKRRWRFRRQGFRSYSFRSSPGSPAFAEEYKWATLQMEPPKLKEIKKVAPIPLRAMSGVELIYFVSCRGGLVKIGKTANIASRFLRLQTGNHQPLELLAVMPGNAADEAALHSRFSHLRAHGEWFRRSPELSALIRTNPIAWWRTEILAANYAEKRRAKRKA